MKNFTTKLLALVLCLTIMAIPVSPAIADEVETVSQDVQPTSDLIVVEEDFTQYSSLADIPNLTYTENDHTTLTLDPQKGLVMTQVNSTPLVEGKTNTKKSVAIGHIVEGKFDEDAEKRTAYRIDRYSGKYKITVDFEAVATKYTEQVDGVTISNPYYLWNFGGVETVDDTLGLASREKLQLRVYPTATTAYSSGSTKFETNNTIKQTDGIEHQLVIDVDTKTKEATVNIDNYKLPASGLLAKDGYLNSFYVASMERMIVGSHFSVKKIRIEQTEEDEATTAAKTALEAIPALATDPNAVRENITLKSYDNITWSTSDESVIDAEGNVTRGATDKDVTITATYKNGDVVLHKDYVLTVKAEGDDPVVVPPAQPEGLIVVEEDFTKYSSLADIPNLKFKENDHTTLTLDPQKGLVMTQVASTPLADGKTNTAKSVEIGHIIEGKFNEVVAERSFYSIDRYSGKYKITVDFEAIATKYTEPVEGVTLSNPYYLWNFGGVETVDDTLGLASREKLQLRVNSTATVAYSAGSTKFNPNHTVKYTEGAPHQLVINVDTATKAVTANVDNYKIPAEGNLAKDGYLNSFYVASMERMIVGSSFSVKKIKIEQMAADDATTEAFDILDSITSIAQNPFEVTDDITLGSYKNVTWSTSDESIIDADGNVTRSAEDKDVTITATYKDGDVVISKNFVLTVKAGENEGGDEPDPDPEQPGTDIPPVHTEGMITVEEDFTKYASIDEISDLAYTENDHAVLSIDPQKGLVLKQIKSTPLLNGATNTNKGVLIGHIVKGVFKADAEKRTTYRIDKYSGKYRITVNYEAQATKYAEPVDGVSITNPYYKLNFGGVATADDAISLEKGEKLSLRMYPTSTVVYRSGSTKFETNSTLRHSEGIEHELVIDVDTKTQEATVNIDNYKLPASGLLAKDGYLNAFYVASMERMIADSYFSIRNIKIEQTEADAATVAALDLLDSIELAPNPFAVTEDVVFVEHDNLTWTTSDETVIDVDGKVIRGVEDKEVTITATYKDGDLVIYKDFVLTVKPFTDEEIVTADVKGIDLGIEGPVSKSIDLPLTGVRGSKFTWKSSNPAVISETGKVTRGGEDVTVTLTVTGTYGSETFSREFVVTVAKVAITEDGVYDELICIEEDYTKYSAIADVPYFEYAKTQHSTVEFVEGKGLVVTQTKATPVLDGAMNKEQTPNISHVIEGNFYYDQENRTAYRLGRFDGKYRLVVNYEVICDGYPDNEYEGVSISKPYYTFALGSVPEPESLTTSIQEALFMRVGATSVTALSTSASGSFGGVKYTSGVPHTMVLEFDTLTRETSINVDNGKTTKTGYLGKPGFINSFAILGMERMLPGSTFVLKKITAQQLEKNENTTKALEALAELPASLVPDPYAVTSDITLPTDNAKITWSTSDASLITAAGKVNRWYADRDVVLTATYTDYDTIISKEYTLTVKELDTYKKTELVNQSGTELEFVEVLGDTTKGSAEVTDNGIKVIKTVGTNTDDAEDMPVYYVDYRLFDEVSSYDASKKESVSATGYEGIYDVAFDLTASVAGEKPVYVVLGNKATNFGEIVSLAVNADGIYVSTKGGMYKMLEEDTYGKTYNVVFRADTNQKRVWVYVNGELANKFFEFDKIDVIDTLRAVIDENNGENDGVVINNIKLVEISEVVVPVKQQLLNALTKLSVNDVTSSPDSVETLKVLPETALDYKVTWVSNSDLIDVVNGNVYHGEEGKQVIVSAMVTEDGVCAKKDFYLYVRGANSGNELVEYYFADIADVITKQNKNDIRYDITLPEEHKGLSISWSSSKPTIIDNEGKLNKNAEITSATDVVLTATTSIGGSTYSRNYTYTVSPRAYDVVVYEGEGAFASVTVNGVENIAVAGTSTTNIKFAQEGNGTITLLDSNGKKIATVNISDSLFNVVYKGGSTVDYPIALDETVSMDVVTMPDVDRIAVFADGVKIADYVATQNDISDIAAIEVVGGINVVSTKITTDEYGILDINIANAGYFNDIDKNVVKEDVSFIDNTIIPANVKWTSSDSSLVNVETGKVNVPSQYKFADITLTLTSANYPAVKRVLTKTVAVACSEELNLAKGVKASVNATAKPGYDIINVTDGNFDTAYATSYAKRSPAITLDFGKETYVNTLYVNESGNCIKNYTVAYSNDGDNWTTVKNGTFTNVKDAVINFNTVYARYISFTVTESLSSDLHINEVEAYLFAEASELAKLDVEQIKLDTGYSVTEDIELPEKGQFGTVFTWESNNTKVIDANGKFTKPSENTTVILTVTGTNEGKTYSKSFSVFVEGKKASGNTVVGGGSGGSGGGGAAPSKIPGFIETDREVEDNEEPVVEPEVTTKDIADLPSNHWAYDNVMKLKELGIIDGVGDNNFNPAGVVTREQFLKMLVEATGIDTNAKSASFTDVDSSAWYAPYVAAGVDAGLVNGITADTFGVGSQIRRQDMAVMIVRILDGKNIPVTETSEVFDDDANISDYAKNAVYKVRDAGIINGYADGTFAPNASLTRAEAATVIIKLLDMLQ